VSRGFPKFKNADGAVLEIFEGAMNGVFKRCELVDFLRCQVRQHQVFTCKEGEGKLKGVLLFELYLLLT